MNIFVVDDHPLMREAVVMLFRRIAPEATIIELDRLAPIMEKVQAVGGPDLLCLDLKLPDTHGVSGVREMRAQFPNVPIVVLSASPAVDFEELSLDAGADVYLEKSSGASHLTQALRALITNDSETSDSRLPVGEKLSRRQRELLQLLDRGLSNRELADHMEISEHTVKVHLWRLFRRIGVKNRSQAVHWARSRGMI
ncbi:MAG: response regulator transcription factor [Brachymonas sp.]|nr:response regulator transcription factor [Brachymonas sp.]